MNEVYNIKKDIEDIKRVFEKHNVRVFLVYGALLGMYRDGKLLPGDDDIDLCVVDPIDFKTRKDIGWDLYNLGFETQPIMFNVFDRMEPVEPIYSGDETTGIIVVERNFKFTIFFFKEEFCKTHGREFVCIPKRGGYRLISIPAKFFDKTDKIKLLGSKFLTPSPIKEYLSYSYEDWKDKKKRDHSPLWNVVHKDYEVM